MNLSFLTTGDPVYLPAFFRLVLERRKDSTNAVYVVPPLYTKQSSFQAALRYWRTFGNAAAAQLSLRLLRVKLQGQSIASVCKEYGVRCEEIADVNAQEFVEKLKTENPDVLVSVSCPQIFKEKLIGTPPMGILNIHGAILPHYRGVMPSFWMLTNGESQAGVSIYFVNEKIDAGELCGQRIFEILPDESLDAFLRRSKAIAADLLLEVLEKCERGTIERSALNLRAGSYYSWPDSTAVKRFRNAGRRIW